MNINEMLFKLSADHLIKQGKRAENEEFECVYRYPESDDKCVIGALISDDHYDPDIEGHTIESCDLILELIARSNNVPVESINVDVMNALQFIHDYFEPSEWAQKLTDFAAMLGYDWTPPEVSAS
jgi:hypothetical protein